MTTVVSVAIRNSLIREGVRRILSDSGFTLAEPVDDLESLIPPAADMGEHLIVIDGSLLGRDGPAIVADILHRFPEARVIALVSSFEFTEMTAIYAAGAYAYFLDEVPYQSLVAMMQMVAVGQKVAPPEIIGLLDNLLLLTEVPVQRRSPLAYDLGEREWEVLGALERGLPNKTISRDIGISESAVKATVKSLLKKLSVTNRTQAAVMARELAVQGQARPALAPPALSRPATEVGPALLRAPGAEGPLTTVLRP